MNLIRSEPLLLPKVPKGQWYHSLSLPKDEFGNDEIKVRFRLRGRLHDGAYRQWWFDDRDDADAFLFALISGSLRYEPALWRLPTPHWHPDLGEGLTFEFATVTFLTSTTQTTYSKPVDWNDASNSVVCLGAGGSGGAARNSSLAARAAGGGGGGYGKIYNYTFSGSTATYKCGVGASGVTRGTAGSTGGNTGTETYFGATSLASAPVGGNPGQGGGAATGTGTSNGGPGGTGKGTDTYTGGTAGAASTSASGVSITTGGAGAAGPNGGGGSSSNINSATSFAGDGGNGDNGSGGSGGTGTGSSTGDGGAGGNGTEYDGTHGMGGGGGGSWNSGGATTAGAGGNYGGGGGGAAVNSGTPTSGDGKQGLVVVTYDLSSIMGGFNLAMMGL